MTDLRRVIRFSDNRFDNFGATDQNCFVLQWAPLLPSELLDGIAIVSGRAGKAGSAADEGETQGENAPDAAFKAGRILLVEDNEINQQVILHQLGALGYECAVAINGQEGIEAWQSQDFALILTDCHMPVMDGFEMTRAMREEEASKGVARMPIIAITANALTGESDRCLSAGMDVYLSKPVKLKDLEATLKKWDTSAPDA